MALLSVGPTRISSNAVNWHLSRNPTYEELVRAAGVTIETPRSN